MVERPELYFPRDVEWREWLEKNHLKYPQGVYLIFHKVEAKTPSMRWEEAVKVALCYGWIDSTVKSLGDGKRKQYFCKRNPKSTWSALNKKYISELQQEGLLHSSGIKVIEHAKKSGKWTEMDHVENLIIPNDLQEAFKSSPQAFENYQNFAPSYRKSYLSWLHNAKRETTRKKRIEEIISLCKSNIKSRS
ncbi:YdeI/OmpD-associated family protein [Marixanthomonas sp. SCSIO 43207]|uniref:YdeI/OmpD-associated family protein n=1 Tax=Marixanthomonas sp. SCSIO 43207 TaxID=2779360 RepID=UPI001CA9232E|nr:YdeI/OmpD-associated family protein [Marixanthomonas sp. SCSIO 43207]UAB80296.1 YdeI/OmpD-associated family protein [Marixanthomonas sp. SCSIO 43207]